MILIFNNTYGSDRGDTEPVVVETSTNSLYVEDDDTFIIFEDQTDSPVMTIEFDGTIKINGKEVEHMSHPDIKAELKKIVAVMQGNSMEDYLFRQTEMLLQEIGKLQAELEECRKQ